MFKYYLSTREMKQTQTKFEQIVYQLLLILKETTK